MPSVTQKIRLSADSPCNCDKANVDPAGADTFTPFQIGWNTNWSAPFTVGGVTLACSPSFSSTDNGGVTVTCTSDVTHATVPRVLCKFEVSYICVSCTL